MSLMFSIFKLLEVQSDASGMGVLCVDGATPPGQCGNNTKMMIPQGLKPRRHHEKQFHKGVSGHRP